MVETDYEQLSFIVDSPVIARIGLDHNLELLELAGDWMRVRVTQPERTGAGREQEFRGTVNGGWVKWRDEKTGPWVWYYPQAAETRLPGRLLK